jgi:hypothetical protein
MVNEEATVLGVVTLESREQQQPERMVAVETMHIPQSEHLATLHNSFSEAPVSIINPTFFTCFNDQNNMMLYHSNELCRQHGGLQYLVSRAFHQTVNFSVAAHVEESI